MRPSRPSSPNARRAVAATILLLGGIALAGTVTHTTTSQFNTGTALNINTSSNEIKLAVRDNLIDDWYRHPYDGSTFEEEYSKDSTNTAFTTGDRCLRSVDNTSFTGNTATVNGSEFRTGPDVININGSNYLETLPGAAGQALPTGTNTVSKVRFLTGGARITAQSYTVTFHYSDATSSAVTVPIKIDTTTGSSRNAAGTNFSVTGFTGLTFRADNSIDGDANGTTDCAGNGGDVVEVTNPNSGKTVNDVQFDYPAYPSSGTVTGWLGGPLAVSLVTTEAQMESTFTYRGELDSSTSTSTAVDAGVHARWFRATWNPVVAGTSEILLHLACGDDNNTNGTIDSGELSAEQTYNLDGTTSPFTLPVVCVGRFLRYRIEIIDAFTDTPKLTDIAFDFDNDNDADGFGAAGTSGTQVDCNDNSASVHPGATETVGDGIDENCDGKETCFADNDDDGHRTGATVASADTDCIDPGEATASDPNDDCNDNNATIHPGATETVGDGVDSDCNGGEICFADADNDGNRHASNTTVSADTDCKDANEGEAGDPIDCDDNNAQRFVGNTEITGDEIDENCDNKETCFADLDGDHARSSSGTVVSSDSDCRDATEAVTSAPIDCDDNDNTQFPGNVETIGNDKDNDCDGKETCYLDNDDDGFRDASATILSNDEDCLDAREAEATDGIDCDETRSSVHPGAIDVCGNGLDDNCNGIGDNGHPSFLDDDGDGLQFSTEQTLGTSDCNPDSDADTLTDDVEFNKTKTSPTNKDTDGDKMNDNVEVGSNPNAPIDTDGDGTIDALDTDDDNDGLSSKNEDWNGNGNPRDDDTDGDTIPNPLDTDDDGDGVSTKLEDVNNNGNYSDDDADADGLPDCIDPDDDNDGILTKNEDVNNNGNRLDDNTDGDGLPDYRDADDDGDGVLTKNENVNGVGDARDDDTDADGKPNYRDTDDDADGILTSFEFTDAPNKDVDADGTQNHLDLDSDGDGLKDNVEGRVDSDGDGIFDYLDTDSDNDTVSDATEVDEDLDGDGKKDRVDSDDDGDGISTKNEQSDAGDTDTDGIPNYRDTDSDGDGWPDSYENTVFRVSTDDDNDGKKSYLDKDSDGDTLLDKNELGSSTSRVDSDGDGFEDRIDSDDDGDCVLTKDEIGNPNPGAHDDFDGDGIVNYLDPDDDNDRESTCSEDPNGDGNPDDDDTDGDSLPNYLDDDDDNDGILTQIENSVAAGRNVDGDGLINSIDPDSDGDGWNDVDEAIAGVLVDSDADATPDFVDFDSDNDKVPDSREGSSANPRDTDFDGKIDRVDDDDDNDLIPTAEECSTTCGDNQPWTDDFDGDGTPDYIDIDDDNDGVPTFDEDVNHDGDPRDDDSELTPDGHKDYLDPDDDNDGIPTIEEDPNNDGNPLDDNTDGDLYPNYRDYDDDEDLLFTSNETEFHDNGSGSKDPRDYDFDGDGIPDYLDKDDDDDGVDTYCEVYVGLDTWLNVDADGDTILDGREWYNFLLDNPDVALADAVDFNGGQTGTTCESPWDRDSDGVPNLLDSDDDNDGLSTGSDELGTDLDCLPGTAVPGGDGIPDYLDTDSDNDGIPDTAEGLGDGDGDTVVDFLDCDSSGCNGDSDNDGIHNCDEETTLCGGLPEGHAPCATNPDYDGDGVIDGVEVGATLTSPKDSDGDGTPDFVDSDDDGDGLPSFWENGIHNCKDRLDQPGVALLTDAYRCTSEDCSTGYWYFKCVEATTGETLEFDFGGNALSDYPNLDAPSGGPLPRDPDTVPNFLDPDDDGDGKLTTAEGMGDVDGDTIPNAYDPDDADGPDADPDGDGLITRIELQIGTLPYDADSDHDGISDGIEIDDVGNPRDSDKDGTIDALDPDDDGDGLPTLSEGSTDVDGDGKPNYLDTDSDGDGKPDGQETDDADADCDGIWDALDANDSDGPCLNHNAGTDGIYTAKGCTCSTTDPASSLGLLIGAAALIARRRRPVR